MAVLLLLIGVLAAASGGLKLRSRVRSLLGNSPLAIAETVAGVLTVLGSGVGLADARPFAWIVVASVVGLIAVSSVGHVRAALRRREKRDASEETRLKLYLQTQSNGQKKELTASVTSASNGSATTPTIQ